MVTCNRDCLKYSMRAGNAVVTCCGIAIIVYSLWLQKRWKDVVAEMGYVAGPPPPWFIYASFGVGILICLNMLFSHMVAHRISITAISIYVSSICFILILQAGLIVRIFFQIKWEDELSKYFDGKQIGFANLLSWHLFFCRVLGVIILFAQVNVLILVLAFRAIGLDPNSRPNLPEYGYSFLVRSDSPSINTI